jgi:hypothetical protein
MAELTRNQLRRKLKASGLPIARNHTYADGVSIVEFIDWWGIQPGAPGTGADTHMIIQTLKHLGLVWKMGNMPMVYREQEPETSRTDDLPRPIQGCLL